MKTSFISKIFAMVGCLAAVAPARAQIILDWNAADGANWSDAGAWTGSTFANNAPVNFTGDFDNTTLTVTSGQTLTVGQVLSGNSNVGGLRVTADLGGGKYTVSGPMGTVTGVALQASTGVSARFNSSGSLNVSGVQFLDQLLTTNYAGARVITGGAGATLRFATASRGYSVLHNGAGDLVFEDVNLTNSDVLYSSNNYNLVLRNLGTGRLVFTGGTLSSRDGVKFDSSAASETVLNHIAITTPNTGSHLNFATGIYTFTGSASIGAHGQYIFGSYEATFNFDAGSSFITGNNVQTIFGSSARLNQATISGTVSAAGAVSVNTSSGTAQVNVSGGYLGTTNSVSVNTGAGYGELKVSAGGYLAGTGITVGNGSGTGALSVSGGTVKFDHSAANNLIIANNGVGTVTVGDGGYINSTNNQSRIHITKNSGTGTLNVTTGGSVSINGDIKLISDSGVTAGARGELNLSGGYIDINGGNSLNINQSMVANTSGVFNISSGTLIAGGIAFGNNSDNAAAGNRAIMNMTGGTVILRNYGIHTGGFNSHGENISSHTAADTQVNLGGGKIVLQNNNAIIAMPLNLTGSNGNVTFEARSATDVAQTLTLSGTLTGAGGLTAGYGTLLLSGVNDYRGQTTVNTGATLTLSTGATLTVSLSDLADLPAFDGSGKLTLNGSVTITDVLTYANAAGEVQLIAPELLGATLTLSNTWLAGFTKSGSEWINNTDSDIIFDSTTGILHVAQIPEPGAPLLLGLGVALLAAARKILRSRSE